MKPASVRSFLSGAAGAVLSTLVLLPIALLLPPLIVLGPAVAARKLLQLSSLSNNDNDAIIGILVPTFVLAATVCASYRTIVLPLYERSRPGSRYASRWLGAVSMLYAQIVLALIVSGPLRMLFLGYDPLGVAARVRWRMRELDARILRVRPPLYPADEGGRSIAIPLRDGVETSATLYSPRNSDGTIDASPRPVVLVRTPYSKESLAPWGRRFSERGYHFVAQDTRGRFGSTGEFFPMLNEARDGAATIEWIERQAWCNGRVGMSGMSYLGICAWAAMREQVPALKAVAPIMAATDLYNVMFGRDAGAAHVELLFRWSHLVMYLMSPSRPFGMLESMFTFFMGTGTLLKKAYAHAPLKEADSLYLVPGSEPLEWFQDGFDNPLGTEPFWEDKRHFVRFEEMEGIPPVLLFCGWYDFFSPEMMHDYRAVSKLNKDCRMVIGPYDHWCVKSMQPKLWRTLLEFFDRHLLEDPVAKDLPCVDAFAMGDDMGWTTMKSWPPRDAMTKQFHFVSNRDGQNLLSKDCPDEEGEISYIYDPRRPTPQHGGATFNPTNCGRLPQNDIEKRDDVLIFTSAPLEKSMLIAGEIQVHLEVESNVEGTDYVARACHVTCDGTSANVADGIVRRFDLNPGERTTVDIALTPVLNRLAAGDSLRIQICSSAYPKYGRHLNTRESFHLELERNAIIGEQILFTGGSNGCKIVVPVLE